MIARLQALLRRPGYRYILVGGSVYIFEVLVILAAQHAGASPVVAVGLSFWLGLIVSFLLQKFVTFRDRRTHHRVLLSQIAAIACLVLANFGFTLLVTKVLSTYVPAVVSRTVALAVTTCWNFYLYKTRIFKTSDDLIY